jgi:hypothetical protein
VPVIADVPATQTLNVKSLRVPADIGFDDFYVVFELVGPTGAVIESVTKRVPHSLLIRAYNTPRVPPRIAVAPFQFQGKNVVEIEQVDLRASRVRLLRRRVVQTEVDISSEYEFVAEIPVQHRDGLVKFVDIVNNSSTLVYRCIAIGPGGVLGSEFSSAVSPASGFNTTPKSVRFFAAAMSVRVTNAGHEVSVSGIPPGVVAVAVMRRNLTLFDGMPTFLDTVEPIRLVGSDGGNTVFDDVDLKQGHVYEYTCDLYFEDGVVAPSTAYAVKKYIPLALSIADIEVTDLQVVRDGSTLDVRFNVNSKLTDDGLSAAFKALGTQDIRSLYTDELEAERDRLQKLIAHQINRIDLTTGVEETFGTVVDRLFSDDIARRKAGVSRLQEGHKYRYVITTLVRDPETMLQKFEKAMTDDATGKGYSFKPAIFRHPITLSRGTLVTRESLQARHPEDEFAHGFVGNSRDLDVTIDAPRPKIVAVSGLRLDRRNISIQWSVDGPVKNIDHFVVVKERLGQSTIAGKMHNVSQGKTFEFFDRVTPDDIGDVSYRIVPVHSDYTRGQEAISDRITIADNRSKV